MAAGNSLRLEQVGLQGLDFLLQGGDQLWPAWCWGRRENRKWLISVRSTCTSVLPSLERERGHRCLFTRARAASGEILSRSPKSAYVSISTGIVCAPA